MLDPQSVVLARELKTPIIARSFDPGDINPIVNDPAVHPVVMLPGDGAVDLSGVIADHRNVLISVAGGAILFLHDAEPGRYEVHTAFLPEFRGRYAIDASRLAYRAMFTGTDCFTILTRIPVFNRPAALAARHVGFVPLFERRDAWPRPDGTACALRFYQLTYDDWLRTDAAHLEQSGHAFHVHFEAERARHGITGPRNHPDDVCHDVAAGACIETIYAGQPEKAIMIYNRWARFSGYQQISLIARSPLVIDIGEALLMLGDRSFKVIKFR